jgi:serine/threonine protein kinase
MDYVKGTDAGRLLSEHYPTGMPVGDVFDILNAVADALDFARDRQLLHRDVKPSNILLTAAKSSRRRILLADFSVARRADEVTGLDHLIDLISRRDVAVNLVPMFGNGKINSHEKHLRRRIGPDGRRRH